MEIADVSCFSRSHVAAVATSPTVCSRVTRAARKMAAE
jgi:hypothetical protein